VKTKLTQQQKEYIWQLMYEKIAGIIRPKDLRYLETQLSRDEEMRETFNALQYALSEEENIDLERLKNDEDWVDLFSMIKPRQPPRTPFLARTRFEKPAIAAMIAGLLLSSAGYYYFSQREAPLAAPAVHPSAAKAVTLQLAGNRTLTLSGKQQTTIGNVQLHYSEQALTFSLLQGAAVHGGQHILSVPNARDYKVTLADSTEVWLNAASRLQFPFRFNGSSREITLLGGEAYIKVAANASRPFIIHTPHSTVQVLGTEFNINAYDPGMVKLALVKGAVRVRSGTASLVVKPGMEAVCTPGKGLYTQPFDARETLSWRTGKHFFVNAPMPEICAILSRLLDIPAVIDSGSTAHNRHFSGMIDKHRPVEEFIKDVKNTTGIDYYFDQQGVLHFR